MQSQAVILALQQSCEPKNLPDTLSALRHDRLVWEYLHRCDFDRYSQWLLENDAAKSWSPANLVLFSLNADLSARQLSKEPMCVLDGNLQRRALAFFEETLRIGKPPVDMQEAGLLALALRERRRKMRSWQGLNQDLAMNNNCSSDQLVRIWGSALTCLYGMIPDQDGLLRVLRDCKDLPSMEWCIQVVLGNPAEENIQAKVLAGLVLDNSIENQARWLKHLDKLGRKKLAEKIARILLSANQSKYDRITIEKMQPHASGAEKLARGFEMQNAAEIFRIGGAFNQANDLFEKSYRLIAQCLADAGLMLASLEADAQNMETAAGRVERALMTSAESGIVNRGAAILQQLGIFDVSLPATEREPGVVASIYLASQMAAKGNLELARQTARQAVDAWLASLASGTLSDESLPNPVDLLAALIRMELFPEAERCAKAILQEKPNDEMLLRHAAKIAELNSDSEQAVLLLNILIALMPQDLQVRRDLARLEEEQGNWKEALDQRRLVLTNSNSRMEEDLLALARCAIEAGEPSATIDACHQVLAGSPDHGMAHTYMGQALLKMGAIDDAIGHLSRATLLCADLPQPWIALAEAQQARGELQRAVDTLRAAILAAPDSSEVHFKLARLLLDQGYRTDALPNLRQAAQLSPEVVSVTIELADTLRHLGHLNEAIRVIHEARQRWPKNSQLAALEGETYKDLGNPVRALDSLEVAIKAEQPQIDWLISYVQLKLRDTSQLFSAQSEDYDPLDLQKVFQALQKILAISPTDFNARMWMADVLRMRGQERLAFETYRQLLDESSEQDAAMHVRVQAGFGSAALAANELDAALASLQEASQAAPDNLGIVHLIAECYLKLNLANEAWQSAEQALAMEPDQVNNLIWYSNLMEKLNRLDDAQRALAIAVQFSPECEELWLKQAQFALQTGQTDVVQESLAKLTQIPKISVNSLWKAAELHLELNNHSQALTCLKTIAAIIEKPGSGLLSDLAFLSNYVGQYAAALEYVEKAIQSDEQNIHLHILQADLLAAQGKLKAALACVEKATRLMESKPLAQSRSDPGERSLIKFDDLKSSPAAIYVRSAVILMKLGDFSVALFYAEKALEVLPNDVSIRLFTANLAYSQLLFDQALELASFDGDQKTGLLSTETETCRQVLRALQCEMLLESNINTSLEDILQNEQNDLAEVHPRLKAIHARNLARSGDFETAWKMFYDLLNWWEKSVQQHEPEIVAPILGEIYNLDLNSYAPIWLGQTAQDLYLWEAADKLIEEGRQAYAKEAVSTYQYANSLVKKQKALRLCDASGSIQHCPKEIQNAGLNFESAINSLSQYSGLAKIAELRQKGKLVFQPTISQLKPLLSDEKAVADRSLLVIALTLAGNLGAAIQVAGDAIDQQAEVLAHLAVSLSTSDIEKAIAAIERAIDVESRNPLYHALRASLVSKTSQSADVAESWLAAIQIWQDEPVWHANLARLSHQAGNSAAAIQHWEAAYELRPSNIEYAYQLGTIYVEIHNFTRAIEILEQATRLDQNDVRIWLALAEAYLRVGHLDRALYCTQRVTSLEPDSLAGMLLQGEVLIQLGNLNAAQEISDRALQRGNSIPEVVVFNVHLLEKRGKLNEALAVLEQAASILSNDLAIQMERVELIRQVYGAAAALPAAKEVAQKFPGSQDVLFLLATILFECGDLKNADAIAQKALRPDLDQPAMNLLLGRIKMNLGQLDQAVYHLSLAVEHQPENIEAYIELGKAYQQRREQDKAVITFQQAIKVAPRDTRAYVLAASALKEAKDYSGAEKMLRKASELAPNDLTIHRQLGAIIALNLVQHSQEAQAWR